MANAFTLRAFATTRCAITRSIQVAVYVPSRRASTSVLYGISALSNRHETQYFSKLSRLPLMEHSPTLKLIHTGEVQRGNSSTLSSSSRTSRSHQEELGNIQQENEDVQTRMGKHGDKLAYTGLHNEKITSREHSRLPHRSKEDYEYKIYCLEQQLVQSKELVSVLQQKNKKQVECHLAESLAAQRDGRRRHVGRMFVFLLYMVGLYAFGEYITKQTQANATRELQSSIEDLLEEITPLLEQARVSAESTTSGNDNLQSGEVLASQRLDGADASSLLDKPTRSWGSLFWKKH